MTDNTPIYNLKAVIQETGLSPAALRAWERRYGLVKPLRSPGGHRLFSRQDIELLKWLVARQKEGLSISQAVEMWKRQAVSSEDMRNNERMPMVISRPSEAMLDALREQWVAACLEFNDIGANQVLDQSFALASPDTISTEVLQKGLAQIGQGWYNDAVSVQQEHFASAIATRRLNTLLAALPPATRPETILAACPPGEEHVFMLLLVTYLLRRNGWNALFLGSNVPFEHLDKTIMATRPSLFLSAAQTLSGAASLYELAQYLQAHELPLAYGGGIFNQVVEVRRRIAGYHLGTNVSMVPGIIKVLVIAPPAIPEVLPVPSQYTELLANFNRNKSSLFAEVTAAIPAGSVDPTHLGFANTYLSNWIIASLKLGDIHLLDPTIAWLDGLLTNYGLSTSSVRQFYNSFRQAVEHQLGSQGELIVDWLENIQ